jgi:hypothetical protein
MPAELGKDITVEGCLSDIIKKDFNFQWTIFIIDYITYVICEYKNAPTVSRIER